MKTTLKLAVLGALFGFVDGLYADSFGSGGDQFEISFVSVGNAGNGDDTGGGGGRWGSNEGSLRSSFRGIMDPPSNETPDLGFRVAMVPEPVTPMLLLLALPVVLLARRASNRSSGQDTRTTPAPPA